MNKQEIFTKVYNHLLNQGCASINYKGECVYRGNYNMMCAIGCLIPDSLYNKDMEGLSVSKLVHSYTEVREFLDCKIPNSFGVGWSDDENFLHALQILHDTFLEMEGLDVWKRKMHEFAEQNNLNVERI